MFSTDNSLIGFNFTDYILTTEKYLFTCKHERIYCVRSWIFTIMTNTNPVPLPRQKPKFIYFDIDDTLLNHKKAEQAGLREIHKYFNANFEGIAEDHLIDTYNYINKGLWEEYGRGEIDRHILHRRRFEETFKGIGVDEHLYEEAGKVYLDFYRNHWEWVKGAEAAYHSIARQYKVGLITNGFAETQRLKIAQFGFERTASQIIISEEVGVMKPHPQIFEHATKLAGVAPHEILYVGDSLSSDVMGSKNAGWQMAWFVADAQQSKTQLADLIFDDYRILMQWLKVE